MVAGGERSVQTRDARRISPYAFMNCSTFELSRLPWDQIMNGSFGALTRTFYFRSSRHSRVVREEILRQLKNYKLDN